MSECRSLRKRWGEVQSPLALISNMSKTLETTKPQTPKVQLKKTLKKKIRSTMEFQEVDANMFLGDPKSLRKPKKKLTKKCESFDYLPDIDVSTKKESVPSPPLTKKKNKYTNNKSRNKENDSSCSSFGSSGTSASESSVEFLIKPAIRKSVSKLVTEDNHGLNENKTPREKGKKLPLILSKKSPLLLSGKNETIFESGSLEFRYQEDESAQSVISKSAKKRRNAPLERQQCFQDSNFEENNKVKTVAGSFIEDDDNALELDKCGDTENSFDLKSNSSDIQFSPISRTSVVLNFSDESPDKKSDGTYEISPQKSFLRQSEPGDNNHSTFEISPSKSVIDQGKINMSEIGDTKYKTPKNNKESVCMAGFSKNTPVFNLRTSQVSTPHPKKSILRQKTPPLFDFSINSEISFKKRVSSKKRGVVAFEESLGSKKIEKIPRESIKSILRNTNGFESCMGKKKSLRLRESIEIIEDKSIEIDDEKKDLGLKKAPPLMKNGPEVDEQLQKVRLRFNDEDIPVTPVEQSNNDLSHLRVSKSNKTNKSSVSFVCTPHPKNRSKDILHSGKLNISENKSNTKPVRTKVPNFARIHQRVFEKMENIQEMQKRKNARAQQLLSGHKPDKSCDSSKNQEEKRSKKTLHFDLENGKSAPTNSEVNTKANTSLKNKARASLEKKKQMAKSRIPKMLTNGRSDYTRFGFKVGEAAVTKNDQIKAVVEKSKVRKCVTEVKRIEVKGVRLNKRFELLMQMRNKK